MGFLTNFVTGFQHGSFASRVDMGTPKTAATVQSDGTDSYKRVDRKKLEQLYLEDAQTFNTINIYKQLLLQTGYKILADNKTVQRQYDNFFDNIGKIGMHMKSEQLVDRILQDTCLYGYAYIEKVFNEKSRIVDLKPVDAKLMDYARNQENMIMVDSTQNVLGYTMNVGYIQNAISDPLPRGIKMQNTQIFVRAERIACFILFPFGNGFESLGIVEPAYEAIVRKRKIETAVANTIHNSAAYPVYAVVGDSQRSASKTLMNSTLEALQNFSSNRYGVFSHPTTLNTLNVEHSPQADEFLRYLRTEQSAASGLALGFTVGTGETVNRSTLGTQKEMLDVRMDSVSYSIGEQFTTKILDDLYVRNKLGSKAKMVWNEVSTEDKIDKTKILLDSITSGVILPTEAREYILLSNDLKGDDLEYKKVQEEKKKQEKQALKTSNQSSSAPSKKSE